MQSGGGMGAGGTGTDRGGSATVYAPQGQPTADWNYGQQIQPLLNTALSGSERVGSEYGSPAANAFFEAVPMVQQGLTQNPYAGQATDAAQNAYLYGAGQLFPQATQGSADLYQQASGGLPYANTALQQGFDPQFQQIAGAAGADPYRELAMGGALQGAGLGAGGAQSLQNMAGQIGGTVNPLIQSGFDPQSALFNRSQAQLMDQTSAINAMSGLSGTPYGAGAMSKAMSDFDIDWQNKQLARQVQAAGAAGNAGTQAGALYGQAPGLASAAAGMPSMVYQKQLGNTLAALQARNAAGIQGAQGYGSLLDTAGRGLQQAQGIGGTGASTLAALGGAPYNTGAGIANNALQGLRSQTDLGNNAFDQSNKQLANLMQYMGLGQNASQVSGQLGQQGFNQTSSGVGGALQGLGMLGTLANTAPAAGSLMGSIFGSAAPAAAAAVPAAASV